MGRFTRTLGPTVTIAGALGLWLAVMVTVGATASPNQAAKPETKAAKAAPAAQAANSASGYVGEDTCLTCHEDQGKNYKGTPHARAQNPRSPAAAKSCETCHGPGQAHVDAGGGKGTIKNPTTMEARDVGELCTSCHNRTGHNEWAGGKHDSRNITCTTCHSVHDFKSEKKQLKTATIQETCVQCHRPQVNKVHRSSHMPLGNGEQKMECTTCHNPHGSQNVKMLREGNSIVEACTSCHSEKRGPFLWEHGPVRESCTTCHDPHGSNNERMLVAKLPMLCQRCHVHTRHPATVYDATAANVTKSNRIVGRSCVNCHSQIHGSNHPSGTVFLR